MSSRGAFQRGWAVSTPRRSACWGYPAFPSRLGGIQARHWVADVIYTPLETELVAGRPRQGMQGDGRRRHVRASGGRELSALHRVHSPTFIACSARLPRLQLSETRSRRSWLRPHTGGVIHADLDRDRIPERKPEREARGYRGGEVRCRRDLRERPRHVQRHARRRASRCRSSSASASSHCSRSATSKACPTTSARAFSPARSASSM